MTNKEAIEILKENLCSMCAYDSQNMESCDIRGCDNRDAIKALEQPRKKENNMTYGDIYEQFSKKFSKAKVSDFRPALPMFLPQLSKGIPNAIIIWLKDGTKVVYMAESEDDND